MKVLWLSHLVPYPPKSGALLRAHHLLRETTRRHEVHLLAFHQPALVAPFFDSPEEGLTEAREALWWSGSTRPRSSDASYRSSTSAAW